MCANLCSAARAFLGAGGLQGLQARGSRSDRCGGRFSARSEERAEVDMFVYRHAIIEKVRFNRNEGAYFQVGDCEF